MRIASLLPSATEIVYALGLGDSLVAVTHECDFPAAARGTPSVTSSLIAEGLPSALIDRAVRESRRDAHTIYALDAERLVALAPDVVLTQSLCDVCAVPRSAVEEAACAMPRAANVVSLDPHTLDGVFESIADAGAALGVPERAERLVAGLRARIDAVRRVVEGRPRPRVLCCEWLDPLYRGGHWVPQQVRLAGGLDGLGREGEYSALVEWDEVASYGPDVVVLMPCGFDAAGAASRAGELTRRPGWERLPAVRSGRVFAVDGSGYFSRPGPRLVDGIELLARILHPESFGTPAPEGAALRLGPSGFEVYP
ncbi:MAG: cobalamin-binding protein [Chloroflexi bacterium]|nr:cobalamin-binding protein [Chloroflexota bacterium]